MQIPLSPRRRRGAEKIITANAKNAKETYLSQWREDAKEVNANTF